jgi:hypothetical protein
LQEARRDKESRSEPFVFLAAQQRVDSFQMALTAIGTLDELYTLQSPPLQRLSKTSAETVAKVQHLLAQM